MEIGFENKVGLARAMREGAWGPFGTHPRAARSKPKPRRHAKPKRLSDKRRVFPKLS